jgi:hypothetical protein
MTNEYDNEVIEYFLENQLQLFPEEVASLPEEAEVFLEDCLACVCYDKEEALEYIHENMDVEDMSDNEILSQPEVFAMNDGRYLIVEG